jgi:hypothetical protein
MMTRLHARAIWAVMVLIAVGCKTPNRYVPVEGGVVDEAGTSPWQPTARWSGLTHFCSWMVFPATP